MSMVFYRWGAGRDESRVTFDGTHISVFDLKREIILNNKMGNGKDFDLAIFDNVTGDELKDDNFQIPRSTSVVARRLPASAKGRGNAQNYIVGTAAGDAVTGDHRIEAHARDAMKDKMAARGMRGAAGTFGSLSKRFDGKEDKKAAPSVAITTGDAEEDAKIQAMLQQNADTWEQMQEDMSSQPRFNAGAGRKPMGKPPGGGSGGGGGAPSKSSNFDYSMPTDKEPPVGYICYRCGQKGHWIQNCPTNDDPEAQDRKRFVRVTGIPRSFLQTVDSPVGAEGSSGGAMLTADGGFVRAVPDARAWKKQAAAKPRALTGADVRDQEPIDATLTCSICKKLVWDSVRVPCCDTAFCEECIQSYLLEHDFECPSCESKVPSLDKVVPDQELRERVKAYVDGEIQRSKDDETEAEEGEKSERPENANGEGANGNAQDLPDIATLQTYLQTMIQTLKNPLMPPNLKAQLQAHITMTNANLMQMQMLAAQGVFMANNMGQPQQQPHQQQPLNNQQQQIQQQSQQQQQQSGNMNGNSNGFPGGGPPGMNMASMNGMNGMPGFDGMDPHAMNFGGMNGMDMNMAMGMGMNPMNMGMGMGMGDMGMGMGNMVGMGGMGNMNGMGNMGNMGNMNGYMGGGEMGFNPMQGMNGGPGPGPGPGPNRQMRGGFQNRGRGRGGGGNGFGRGGSGGGGMNGMGGRQFKRPADDEVGGADKLQRVM